MPRSLCALVSLAALAALAACGESSTEPDAPCAARMAELRRQSGDPSSVRVAAATTGTTAERWDYVRPSSGSYAYVFTWGAGVDGCAVEYLTNQ